MGQNEIVRPVAFRPHLTVGLVLSKWYFGSQQNAFVPSGARLAHFEVFIHGDNLLNRGLRIGKITIIY
jgi:hypothetical protein